MKVLLVDDHPVVRSGLVQLIGEQPDMAVCGEADDVGQALRFFAEQDPDVAIVDLSLQRDLGGIELIRDIRNQYPRVRILVVSMYDESVFAERALRAGAMGYVMKTEAPETLVKAIRSVAKGEVHLSAAVARRIVSGAVGAPQDRKLPTERLTDRELEVFQAIGRGLGTSAIAKALKLSVKTVETYRARIKEKLGLPDAAALLERAIQWAQGIERG